MGPVEAARRMSAMSLARLSEAQLQARIEQAEALLAWLEARGERRAALAALLARMRAEFDRREAARAERRTLAC
jgi:hypothetical protein